MAREKKKSGLTRRVFLIGSAAIAGGVAFGIYQYNKQVQNPLESGEGEIALNPYLMITQEGVTIITPRAEMGQGIQTSLAALVAEELDVAWDEIQVIHGPASAAYYNAEVLKLGLPFSEYQGSVFKDFAHGSIDVAGKLLGIQLTGGSTSTRDAFETMRKAGAAARLVLLEAAAQELNVSVGTLNTENGFVISESGERLSYQALAVKAATIEAPQDPPLKRPSDWRYLGKSMPRFDMAPKVTGTAEFGADVRLEGMLYATVRVNPRLGGSMKSFNATTAETMRGVEKIVDLGDGVGVIADNTWRAFQAADAIEIEWDEAPYPASTDGVFEEIALAFEKGANSTLRNDGDAEKVLGENENVLEVEYRVPYLAHATMEPMNATALLKDGTLDVWVGNQAPTLVRDKVAAAAGLSPADVRVHTPFMGGGFGRRAEYDNAVQATKLAMAVPGRAVKMIWTREEDMRHDFYRPGAIARMTGIVEGKAPIALKADIAAPSVLQNQTLRALGFAQPGPDKILVEGAFDQPYAIPNYQVNGYVSDVKVPVGSWRSVGNSYNGFFHECFMDELAISKGIDPLAMRLDLMKDVDRVSYDVLQAVGDIAGWGAPTGAGRGRGAGFGRGVAFTYSFGSPTAQIIDVSQRDGGIHIDKVWCAIDVGTAIDPRNIEAQIMSAVIYGLSAAIYGEITFEDGEVVEGNFDSYDALRMVSAPAVETKILENNGHIGGVGEPGTPPSMPALANAVFDLTGNRIRHLPLGKIVSFV